MAETGAAGILTRRDRKEAEESASNLEHDLDYKTAAKGVALEVIRESGYTDIPIPMRAEGIPLRQIMTHQKIPHWIFLKTGSLRTGSIPLMLT